MASITFTNVEKRFDDGTLAVDALDLEIADGEFLVLVGPSGCGKTTSLRMAAGLEDPTSGEIRIGDQVVNDLPSRSRDIAMVFQSYALYPHMTVRDNIGFGLRMRGVARHERRRRAAEVASILDITELLDRRPKQLSGGQRQRVAMGRAIVREPRAFLMDEPLSNLDAKLRVQMRAEIARIQKHVGTTTLYVTHDQVEAMTMGDRVAVMRRGILQQVDVPKALYDQPRNLFVAGFIGSPAMNLVEAHMEEEDGQLLVTFGSHRLEVGAGTVARHPRIRERIGRTVALGIRPEDIEDAAIDTAAPPRRRLRVTVDLVEALGSDLMIHAPLDASPVRSDELAEIAADVQGVDAAEPHRTHRDLVLVARCSARSTIDEGDAVEVTVDTDRLHLFDPATGEALR